MKVFKFGGASVKDADSIRNMAKIIDSYSPEQLFIVVSAMGKITNALEDVIKSYFYKRDDLNANWQIVKDYHFSIVKDLFSESHPVYDKVNALFSIAEKRFEQAATESFDCVYDQIVSTGELVSTTIIQQYLDSNGIPATWLDARKLIRTNDTFREGKVDWTVTPEQFKATVPSLLKKGCVVTQGFIGSAANGMTTTLGREGSDFTAAIAAFCLDAKNMTVWKDVPGILTADPRLFKNVAKLDRISFREAIEMTYYGAKVIHPKTIKPLQNKSIPLLVKSFIDPKGEGTMISENLEAAYPPVIVVERHQALIQVARMDFSFVDEESLSELFALFAHHRIKVNMMQNTAIGFSICIDNVEERIHGLLKDLREFYKVFKDNHVELITVRHYKKSIVDQLQQGKMVLLEERIRGTLKMVVKDIPIMERIDK